MKSSAPEQQQICRLEDRVSRVPISEEERKRRDHIGGVLGTLAGGAIIALGLYAGVRDFAEEQQLHLTPLLVSVTYIDNCIGYST